ncbi:MAG: helix-turn-helix domain-containing protein [Proteobacteria bacterium]|nr:helix-turn-helix domain-containing protein [Pseudomonadota bacterium]
MVLSIVLRRRSRNVRANRYLSNLLAALAVVMLHGSFAVGGILAAHPHLIGFSAWVPFLLGPLLFLYVREMTAIEPVEQPSAWRHFVAAAVYVVLLIVTFYLRSPAYKLQVLDGRGGIPWFVTASEAVLVVHGISYVIAALVLLRRHRPHVQALYSNVSAVSLRWLLVLVALSGVVWGAALLLFGVRISGHTGDLSGPILEIVPLGSTAVIFVIGYFQLGQSEIFIGQQSIAQPMPAPPPAPVTEPVAAPLVPPPTTPPSPPEASPYQKARLPEADADDLEARIKAAMLESRLYLRAGLTLAELAEAVAATSHEVSQVLSVRLKRNFYGFVNEHRVEHVKTVLATGERADQSVLEIALEAGFQSKSTFNSAFRKATGVTPREYRQSRRRDATG